MERIEPAQKLSRTAGFVEIRAGGREWRATGRDGRTADDRLGEDHLHAQRQSSPQSMAEASGSDLDHCGTLFARRCT